MDEELDDCEVDWELEDEDDEEEELLLEQELLDAVDSWVVSFASLDFMKVSSVYTSTTLCSRIGFGFSS